MKKSLATILAVIGAILPVLSLAGSDRGVERANTQIRVRYAYLAQDYKEYNDGIWAGGPEVLDTETGTIKGAILEGGAFVKGGFVAVRFSGFRGDTDYDGYIDTTPPTPAKTTTENRITDHYLKGGYLFKIDKGTYLGPVLELGNGAWRREIGMGTPNAVDEMYNHYYGGLGLVLLHGFTDNFAMKLEGTYGSTFGATVKAPQFNFDNEELGNEKVTRAGLTLDYRLVSHVHVMAGVESYSFGYGASKVNSSGFIEPRSDTKRVSYNVGLGVSFR